MKVVGFNLSKISAEKKENFSSGKIHSNIELLDLKKDEIEFLKEASGLNVKFKHTIDYHQNDDDDNKLAEIQFEGALILTLPSNEADEILEKWKDKKLPLEFKTPLYNFILKRCTLKAVQLQDELNVPTHIKMPAIRTQLQN